MPLKCRDIAASLGKKGFREQPDGDHVYFRLFVNNRKTSVFTKVSHGCREVDDSLVSKMAKQVQLRPRMKFIALVDCSLTGEAYVAELRAQGFDFRAPRALSR